MMTWNQIAQIAPGGPVLETAVTEKGEKLLVSPTGLLKQEGNDWRLLMRGVPFWQTHCAAVAEETILLSGLPTGIIRSFDKGRSWVKTFIDQQTDPVVKIVPSPNYAKDRVMLAATDGDGILRSKDGGRHWQLSNFGLREFNIIDLVVAPMWDNRYEYVFAVSDTAVYQSPNGGRAWRRGVCDEAIRPSALAVSPNFQDDQTVFLGTEDGNLFCTHDAGRQWQIVASGFGSVHSLCVVNDALFVGGFEQITCCLRANFDKRDVVYTSELPILSVSIVNSQLMAMLVDGVMVSDDNGRSWNPINGYSARRFVWVKSSPQAMVVAGPEDGVWVSRDKGANWALVWADGTVLDIDLVDQTILVSSDIGLFASENLGETWLQEAAIDDQIMGVVIDGATRWYGGQFSTLRCRSNDQLKQMTAPFVGSNLLDMQKVGGVLTAAVYHADSSELQLWQWQAESDGWQLAFSERAQSNKPVMFFDEVWGLVVGVSEKLYLRAKSGWQLVKVSSSDAPITAVYPQQDSFLIAATDKLFKLSKTDPSQIEAVEWGGDPILYLDEARIVTVNGRVYQNVNV